MKAIKVLAIFLITILFLACAADSSDNSVAGATWTQATSSAAWSARYYHSSVVYDDKIWVLGGINDKDVDDDGSNIDTKNDVWFSEDGRTWTQATSSAAWSSAFHSSLVFDNKLWVLGGDGDGGGRGSIYKNDVWFSADGSTWTQATSDAVWSDRVRHSSVVFDHKLWVLGGKDGDSNYKNDVWFSTDGRTWTQATDTAGWSARGFHTSVVFDNKFWVLGSFGGNDGDIEFENDVWLSDNGITWTQTTSSAAWSARGGHSSVVYDNKIWVLGGLDAVDDLDNDRNIEVKNDVWFSADGATWTQATSSAAWSARGGHSSVVYDNKIWVLGGFGDDNNGTLELKNDVWYLD